MYSLTFSTTTFEYPDSDSVLKLESVQTIFTASESEKSTSPRNICNHLEHSLSNVCFHSYVSEQYTPNKNFVP